MDNCTHEVPTGLVCQRLTRHVYLDKLFVHVAFT